MESFQNAQKLFDAYQKHGRIINFTDSLDILDEIIESQGNDSRCAINFKQMIGRYVDSKIDEIYLKSNLDEFKEGLTDNELWKVLFQALSEEDLRRLIVLIRIKTDYFRIESPEQHLR